MKESYYGYCSYDLDELENVPTFIDNADNSLQSAKNILSNINIPGDFTKGSVISESIAKIKKAENQLSQAKSAIRELLFTLMSVNAANKNITHSIPSNLRNIGKLNKITSETMKKELREKISNTWDAKPYTINGKTRLLTNAEYIAAMRKKANAYGSKTNYSIIVDADNAQVTIFYREDKDKPWQCIALWDSIQGVKESGHLPGESENPENGPDSKVNWKGPHSRSFTGNMQVVGKSDRSQGLKTCYCPCNHSSDLDVDNCQGFEPSSWGDPDDMNKKRRFESHGCTNLNYEKAKWIYNIIPVDTKVVVFNDQEQWPGLKNTKEKINSGLKKIYSQTTSSAIKKYEAKRVEIIEKTIEAAMGQEGKPYNEEPSAAEPDGDGFNCSGLVWWAFEQAGYKIPHAQCDGEKDAPERGMIDIVYKNNGGFLIKEQEKLERGDLLFYNQDDNTRESNHVAIYLGDGSRIHSGGSKDQVMIDDQAFNDYFIGGGPIISAKPNSKDVKEEEEN